MNIGGRVERYAGLSAVPASPFGSSDSGASLGDILGAALAKKDKSS